MMPKLTWEVSRTTDGSERMESALCDGTSDLAHNSRIIIVESHLAKKRTWLTTYSMLTPCAVGFHRRVW